VCGGDRERSALVVEDRRGEFLTDAAEGTAETAARHDGDLQHLAVDGDDLLAAEQCEVIGAGGALVLAVHD
jgi:hypothetical protein